MILKTFTNKKYWLPLTLNSLRAILWANIFSRKTVWPALMWQNITIISVVWLYVQLQLTSLSGIPTLFWNTSSIASGFKTRLNIKVYEISLQSTWKFPGDNVKMVPDVRRVSELMKTPKKISIMNPRLKFVFTLVNLGILNFFLCHWFLC